MVSFAAVAIFDDTDDIVVDNKDDDDDDKPDVVVIDTDDVPPTALLPSPIAVIFFSVINTKPSVEAIFVPPVVDVPPMLMLTFVIDGDDTPIVEPRADKFTIVPLPPAETNNTGALVDDVAIIGAAFIFVVIVPVVGGIMDTAVFIQLDVVVVSFVDDISADVVIIGKADSDVTIADDGDGNDNDIEAILVFEPSAKLKAASFRLFSMEELSVTTSGNDVVVKIVGVTILLATVGTTDDDNIVAIAVAGADAGVVDVPIVADVAVVVVLKIGVTSVVASVTILVEVGINVIVADVDVTDVVITSVNLV